MFVPNSLIEQWIEEDVPGFDLTSHLLQMNQHQAVLRMKARHQTTLCGTEEAAAVFQKLGAEVVHQMPSGSQIDDGETFFEVKGTADLLHAGWRVASNLVEYASGIATRTAQLVNAVRSFDGVQICGTRKAFPGGRRISQKALVAGGGIHHRMGLGETILIFPNHYGLIGFDAMLLRIPEIRKKAPEKKIGLEVYSVEEARQAIRAGVDTLQLDKFSPEEVREVVAVRESEKAAVCIAAAGGVNLENAEAYGATGADILVTSWMYFGKPADISASIVKDG